MNTNSMKCCTLAFAVIALLVDADSAVGQCVLFGDVNQDQQVTLDDVSSFTGCLVGQPLGGSECDCADINDDAHPNGADIAGFIALLLEPGPATGACCSWIHPHCQMITAAECDELSGTFHGVGESCSGDMNGNGSADICETDCNQNALPDEFEIGLQLAQDCDGNGVPDMCDPDCNGNGIPDPCEILLNPLADCNHNRRLDDCDIALGLLTDCDGNGIADECEIANCDGSPGCGDCNRNGVLDSCDIAQGNSSDCDQDGRPDKCARCLIPGDLNGDRLVTAADDPFFFLCISSPCPPVGCECADINDDGLVDPADQGPYDDIRNGTTPAQTMAIVDFNPKELTEGGIVEIDGFGFGEDFQDLSVAAASPDGNSRIPLAPFELVPIPNDLQRIRARVGALTSDDQPGLMEVRLGDGATGPFPFQHPGAITPQGGRRWQVSISPFAADDHPNFDDFALPSFLSPCLLSALRAGTLSNGHIGIMIPRGFDSGARLRIQFSAFQFSGQELFGVEGNIPRLEFTADKDAVERLDGLVGQGRRRIVASLWLDSDENFECDAVDWARIE